MNTEITAWFNSDRDFDQGFALYQKYGTGGNAAIMRILQGKRTRYCAGKLAWELEKLLGTPDAFPTNKITIIEESVPEIPQQATVPGIMMSPEAWEVGKQLEEKKKTLYKEATFLHQTALWEDKPETERATAAVRIVEIMEELLPDIWAILDHIRDTGNLPEGYGQTTDVNPDLDLAGKSQLELAKLRANCRSNVSRNKSNPLKAEKVLSWRQQIEAITKILGDE